VSSGPRAAGSPSRTAGVGGVEVNPSVVDPRRDHLHRPRAGQYLPRLVTTIAHHQPPAPLVALANEPVEVGIHLGLQRLRKHPPSAFPEDLVNQRQAVGTASSATTVGLFEDYGEHRSYLPDRRWRAGLA